MLAVAGALLCAPASALELYDSFDKRRLQSSHWHSGWISPHALDVRRYISNGALNLRLLGVGDETTQAGRTVSINDVAFVDSVATDLRAVEMLVVVNEASAKSCSVDGNPSLARFRHWGRWFNDGSSSGPGDETGDFHSFIEVRKVAGQSENEIRFYAYRCTDSSCSSYNSPVTGSTWLTDVPFGTTVKLRTSLDLEAGTISFKAAVRNKPAVSRTFDYTSLVSAVQAPANPSYSHLLQARIEAANCSVDARKLPTALIDASVLRVRVERAQGAISETLPDSATGSEADGTDAPVGDDAPTTMAPAGSQSSGS